MRGSFRVPGGLYAILDEHLVEDGDWAVAARQILDGGARVVQLRAKTLEAGDMLDAARKVLSECERFGAVFIVNDRVDVALVSGAHGVHVGQEDLPVWACRKILGSDVIVGLSTHHIEEAVAARDSGADYIGFGPIFESGTKITGREPRGVDRLSEVVRRVSMPVVAIGGVNAESIGPVKKAGAAAGAVIGGLAGPGGITESARRIIRAWESEA